jgi:hypothetical protein
MSVSGGYFARFSTELNVAQVFDAEGILQKGDDAVCLGDMLSELLDEMGRRGFDMASASFAIDRNHERGHAALKHVPQLEA